MRARLLGLALGFGVAASLAGSAVLADPPAPRAPCFATRNWDGWKSPNPKVIYLRVNMNQIYRLDLSAGSEMLQDPGVHLVNWQAASDWVCSPIDLNLAVADDMGHMREHLFVKSITRLTPEEAAAIPPKYRP